MTRPLSHPRSIGVRMSYCTIDQAKAAGASGTDTEIQAAIDQAKATIDLYCRETFEPTNAVLSVFVGADGQGRLSRWAASVEEGYLAVDGFTWSPVAEDWYYPYVVAGEYHVPADIGSREVPVAVQRAAARLAAIYSPVVFTGQSDAEGNPIGRAPGSTLQDESDPAPPTLKAGGGERTTGDLVVDSWLEPYKTNRALV